MLQCSHTWDRLFDICRILWRSKKIGALDYCLTQRSRRLTEALGGISFTVLLRDILNMPGFREVQHSKKIACVFR
jgi:hypothetical protein